MGFPAPGLLLATAVGVAAAAATGFGGVLALRFRSALDVLLAFGSGAVLGVALLDLLPEALTLGEPVRSPSLTSATVLAGFLLYLAADRVVASGHRDRSGRASRIIVISLVVHSVLDGFGIGCAFQAGAPVGLAVAAGVIAHDLVDGANTVAFSLEGRASLATASRWLIVDALAPAAGLLLSSLFRSNNPLLSTILAFMAGGFVFIGVGHLLPRLRSGATIRTVTLTISGLLFVFIVTQLKIM